MDIIYFVRHYFSMPTYLSICYHFSALSTYSTFKDAPCGKPFELCFLLFFSLNVFYGQAFINLFYSSSPLFQFPGKKPLVGRNVRAISVSVPFFPCVNALPSKSTASLCIYCVRRWVLSFFPLFMDEICPLFLRAESDMVMDCWCARSERLNERTS